MRRSLLWTFPLFLIASFTQAAESPAPQSSPNTIKVARSASADSDEGDAPKSGTFLGRLFGKSQEAKTPDTSAPTKKNSASTASAAPKDPKAESANKLPAKVDPTAPESKTAKKPSGKEKEKPVVPEAPKTDDERFIFAKKTASEDPKVVELRNKADAATDNADADRLTRSYLRTLYGKMRTLEPTLKERIDMTEAAALRMVPEPPRK